VIIKKIAFENYGIYQGENSIEFSHDKAKNVFLISGENGFGKTTFLTGLVWCLYGKLMVDVDEKYKREIYEFGGYKKYASNKLNRAVLNRNSYSVSVVLSDINIPAVPCKNLEIKRTFNMRNQEDQLEILIDGNENELTKDVGSEIFIHDFILPKEIAKFFFFDAEKIVSLAEMKSIEDRRNLGKAYSEVLGIKKYVDLRDNLIDLRLRFSKESATPADRKKFDRINAELKKLHSHLSFNKEQILNLSEEKEVKRKQSENFQEKLIREGNSLTLVELLDLKKLRDNLKEENKKNRLKLKSLLDLAPFAIAGNKLKETYLRANKELLAKSDRINPALLDEKAKNIITVFEEKGLNNLDLDKKSKKLLKKILSQTITAEFKDEEKDFKTIIDFSEVEQREFVAIWDNITTSYSRQFKSLTQKERKNRIAYNKIIRKISNAESKENDLLIQQIREEKNLIDSRIQEIEEKVTAFNQDIGAKQKEVAVLSRTLAELAKRIEVDDTDKEKDELARRQIDNLGRFLDNLKLDKKTVLEKRIKDELNTLMHKRDFIAGVEVSIEDELIDINLLDSRNQYISKESMSKGEQQLYATAILKALVDESNINFPVFIDSPLQKFDKKHSRNIIKDFYPNISDQVVLFPLIEKELSRDEYKILLPKVNSTFIINNINDNQSQFIKVSPEKLFDTYHEQAHTY